MGWDTLLEKPRGGGVGDIPAEIFLGMNRLVNGRRNKGGAGQLPASPFGLLSCGYQATIKSRQARWVDPNDLGCHGFNFLPDLCSMARQFDLQTFPVP